VSKSRQYKKQRRLLISKNTIAYFNAFFQTNILISSHLAPEANLISFSASRFCRQMARKQFHMQTPGIWQQQLAQNTLRLRQPHR